MPKKYMEAGKFVGTHGVRGELRVQPWCDGAEFLTNFKVLYKDNNGNEPLKVLSSRAHGNICLVKLQGIETIEQAEALRGKIIYINRDDCILADGQYFIDDIIGCQCIDFETGKIYGKIADVSQTGANDVWHVKSNGNEYLIPNVPEFVKQVDIYSEKVYITPLKGIFDDED